MILVMILALPVWCSVVFTVECPTTNSDKKSTAIIVTIAECRRYRFNTTRQVLKRMTLAGIDSG